MHTPDAKILSFQSLQGFAVSGADYFMVPRQRYGACMRVAHVAGKQRQVSMVLAHGGHI